MALVSYLFLITAALFQMVACGNAWFYQSSNSQPSNQLLSKHQFLLPPYPTYQHELLHQPHPSHLGVHDNRFYGNPGEFAEPSSYNELSFEGPYEVTAPRVPGLYFRLSSGVFVPVKAVYSFPPFLERIIQRIQGYYSVYNPPETLGLDRPIHGGGVHGGGVHGGGVPLPPTLEILPVIPPQIPPSPLPGFKPEEPPKPEDPNPSSTPEPSPESPENEPNEPSSTELSEPSSTSTTESTREETTPIGEISSATDSLESSTDSAVEDTTTA